MSNSTDSVLQCNNFKTKATKFWFDIHKIGSPQGSSIMDIEADLLFNTEKPQTNQERPHTDLLYTMHLSETRLPNLLDQPAR